MELDMDELSRDKTWCMRCGLATVKWLADSSREKERLSLTYVSVYWSAIHGNVKLMEWLLDRFPDLHKLSLATNLMVIASQKGLSNVVDWMYVRYGPHRGICVEVCRKAKVFIPSEETTNELDAESSSCGCSYCEHLARELEKMQNETQ
jgi:hypothetical protein